MPESHQPRKVSVEDLLRLKRAERPGPEFWASFEHELRQKQLTALMQKRSWWQGVPQIFARRAYVPLGAAAILTFTLISIKYSTPLQVAQVEPLPRCGLRAKRRLHRLRRWPSVRRCSITAIKRHSAWMTGLRSWRPVCPSRMLAWSARLQCPMIRLNHRRPVLSRPTWPTWNNRNQSS